MTRKRRLATQLYLVVAAIFAAWFLTLVTSLEVLNNERQVREEKIERERIRSRVNSEIGRILSDILLEHNEALKLTLRRLGEELDLDQIELTRPNRTIMSIVRSPNFNRTNAITERFVVEFDGNRYGEVQIRKKYGFNGIENKYILMWMIIAATVMTTLFVYIQRFIDRSVTQPIVALLSRFCDDSNNDFVDGVPTSSYEISELASNFESMQKRLVANQISQVELERAVTHSNLARQVAHDIRSPLAALLTVNDELFELGEEKRNLVRSAIGRIQDIANSLLDASRTKEKEVRVKTQDGFEQDICMLSSAVEEIVSEKRIQLRTKKNVSIRFSHSPVSFGVFAQIDSAEIRRVLSNLIDNSVEAVNGTTGEIVLAVSTFDNLALIEVTDNGKGMPDHIISRLGECGFSSGKLEGNGFGLWHAFNTLERWKGIIEVSSTVGKGTKVTLKLPLVKPPAWFVPRIEVVAGTYIVVLDDDRSMHLVWQKRFSCFSENQVVGFSNSSELLSWWSAKSDVDRLSALVLFDFELLGSEQSGISVVEQMGQVNRRILVTSHFEEPEVQAIAREKMIPILPKGLTGFVPINLQKKCLCEVDTILIDNDPLVRATWEISAAESSRSLAVFSSAEEFLKRVDEFSMDASIYVDAIIKVEHDGLTLARELQAKGFRKVSITTGLEEAVVYQKLGSFTFFVIDKMPPWSTGAL